MSPSIAQLFWRNVRHLTRSGRSLDLRTARRGIQLIRYNHRFAACQAFFVFPTAGAYQ
jgi:hypothetical protein